MSELANRIRVNAYIAAMRVLAEQHRSEHDGVSMPTLDDLASGSPFLGNAVEKDATRSATNFVPKLELMLSEYQAMYMMPPRRIVGVILQ